MVGNLTNSMWLHRSCLWNLVALQATDGGWSPDDAIAGAFRAAGDPVLAPDPMGKPGSPPVVKSYFNAEVVLECMPRSLQACAAKHGWRKIDRVWCTLLAVNAYDEMGNKWIINPWDLEYEEYDVYRKAWSFLDVAAKDDPVLAAVILESEVEAKARLRAWRDGFMGVTERFKTYQDKAGAEEKRAVGERLKTLVLSMRRKKSDSFGGKKKKDGRVPE